MSMSNVAQSNIKLQTAMEGGSILNKSMMQLVELVDDLIYNKNQWIQSESGQWLRDLSFYSLNEFDQEKLTGLYLNWRVDDMRFEFCQEDNNTELQTLFANALISGEPDLMNDFIKEFKKTAIDASQDALARFIDDRLSRVNGMQWSA